MKRAVLLTVFGAAIIAGCSKGGFSSRATAGQTNTFSYPIVTIPTTLDPGKVEDGDTIDLLQQCYEGLVGWDENSKVAHRLATGWDVSKDGRIYTFHLRKGVKFHNGREMTADDFKWCIERNCNPAVTSTTAATYLAEIVGVKDRLANKAKEVSGVKVVDPYTLTITIDKARPYWIGKMTYPVAFVFAKEALTDPTKPITEKSQMVGTGGFKFDEVRPETEISFVPNKDYYEGAPKIDKLRRPYIGDAPVRLMKYKNGEIDIVQLERQDVATLEKDPQFKNDLKYFDRPSVWYVGLNCNVNPAFKDVRVRRAVAMAIDKETIVNKILGGINKTANGIVPPGVFGHRDQTNAIKFDPAKAKALLAEAGHADGKGMTGLEIYCRNNRPDITLVAETICSQLKQNLGLDVTVHPMEWGAYLAKHDKHEIPFFHMRWGADYLDAENFLSTLLADYGNENKLNYNNAKFNALCAKADASLDPNERLKLYAEAEDIALQDAAFIPIYFQRDAELIRPRLQGLRESLFGHLPHTKVSLK